MSPGRSTPDATVTCTAVSVISDGPSWTHTTVLNIVFLVVAAVLVVRFLRTGGLAMLHLMNTTEEEMAQHDQAMPGWTTTPCATPRAWRGCVPQVTPLIRPRAVASPTAPWG
jgi:hypothetical protein